MKNIVRLTLISFISFCLFACGDSEDPIKIKDGKPEAQFEKTLFEVRSPDKQRTAKVVLREGIFYFIVDGKESEGYKSIGIDPPVFSPDSRHIAYVIKRGDKASVVLDGRESEVYLDISAATAYQMSKKRESFTAQQAETLLREGWILGKKGLVFSPDSSRLAFCAWISDKQMVVVVDWERGPVFDAISSFGVLFSQDSRNITYVAQRAGSWHVVVNDKISEGYEAVGNRGLKFSPGWDRVAFRAKKGGWKTVEWQIKKK